MRVIIKRKKTENETKAASQVLSELFGMPESTLGTTAMHIEFNSAHEAVIERCGGVLEYTDTVIRLICGKNTIKFTGVNLAISVLTRNSAVVRGNIESMQIS